RLDGESPGDALRFRFVTRLVPERQRDVLASVDRAQRILELEQIHAVPGREQDVAVVAVAAPPSGTAPPGSAKGFAVVAAENEERARILRRELLDPLPGAHEVLERLLVAARVVALEVRDRPADAQGLGHFLLLSRADFRQRNTT